MTHRALDRPDTQCFHTLRIVAAYAIVLAHVAGGLADTTPVFSAAWWTCKLLYGSCLWAVPVFVMVSGALLLDPARTETPGRLVWRRLRRIGPPLVAWTALYLGWRVHHSVPRMDLEQIVSLILSGRPYAHLWFLYMIVGLYVLTPVLRTWVRLADPSERLLAIGAALLLGDATHLVNVMMFGNTSSVFTLFLPFIGYYLLGYEVFHHHLPWTRQAVWAGLASGLGYMLALGNWFVELEGQRFGLFFFSFFCPPAVLASIGVFSAVRRWHERLPRWWRRHEAFLASLTLGIYVIHVGLLQALQAVGGHDRPDGPDLALALLIGPPLAFVASGLVTALLQRVLWVRAVV